VLSLRVSRDKRGYDHIYLLLETRRKGRTVTRLLYGGRWPSPMKIGQQPLDEATRKTLEQAYPEVTFDWAALQRTLQQALATPRAPMTPETRRRRAAGPGVGEGRPAPSGPGSGSHQGGPGGRQQQGSGRVPPTSRPQMPPRQRPPYASGFGEQGDPRGPYDPRDARDLRERSELPDDIPEQPAETSLLDDTADLPYGAYGAAGGAEPDADVDLPVRPYDEPVLEEGLETESRRGGLSDMPAGPEEIVPVEERTFVVSTDDDDSGEIALAREEPADDRDDRERAGREGFDAGFDPGGFERAKFERPELPGPGFTRDEFPVVAPDQPETGQGAADRTVDSLTSSPTAGPGSSPTDPAATDPAAPPRRRRRRRRGGRRSHGGPNAASQPGGGPPPETGAGPDHAEPDDDGHDDDSDV
jgi:hypothetical protein